MRLRWPLVLPWSWSRCPSFPAPNSSTFRDYQPLSTLFFPCWHFKKAFKLSCEGFLLSVQSDYAGNLFVYDFGEVPLERGRQGLIKICRRSRIHSVITVWVKVWG